jgi:hypothetical protein
MKFGWEKCAKISFKSGKVCRKQHMGNTMVTENKELDTMKAYIYLGLEEGHNIDHKKEYIRRLRLILSTELSARNKVQATGSLAIPVQRYSSGIN